MATTPLKLLVIEDSPDDLALLLMSLRRGGFEVTYRHVQDRESLLKALSEETFQIAVSDYNMPHLDAHKALEIVRPTNIPFFVVSGTIDEDIAVELMRAGAQDYVMKGNLTRLIPAIHRELEEEQRRIRMRKDLQQKEDQLRQAQKMEAIGRLASGIAHDFNNFLGGITVMMELLEKKIGRGHSAFNDLTQVHNAVERAADLPRQLLTFSRKQTVEFSVLDLNLVIRHIEKMLEQVLGKDITFELDLDKGLDRIHMDRSQIEQTVMNFVVNARDAMTAGGKVSVRTRNLLLDETLIAFHSQIPAGRYVVLQVEDTGCGMTDDTLKCAFEPFFTTKGEKGTGLGLATVYGIVQKAKGFLNVKSEIGRGTTFEIYFPAREPGTSAGAPKKEQPKAATTVLLVDDHAMLRAAMADFLKTAGYLVLEAGNATEAIAIASSGKKIDLLVTDLSMPEMSGIELIRHVGAVIPQIKVMLVSGCLDQNLLDQAQALRKIEYLQKPFSIDAFLKKVKLALHGKLTSAA